MLDSAKRRRTHRSACSGGPSDPRSAATAAVALALAFVRVHVPLDATSHRRLETGSWRLEAGGWKLESISAVRLSSPAASLPFPSRVLALALSFAFACVWGLGRGQACKSIGWRLSRFPWPATAHFVSACATHTPSRLPVWAASIPLALLLSCPHGLRLRLLRWRLAVSSNLDLDVGQHAQLLPISAPISHLPSSTFQLPSHVSRLASHISRYDRHELSALAALPHLFAYLLLLEKKMRTVPCMPRRITECCSATCM